MDLRINIEDKFINELKSKLEGNQLGEVTGSRMAQDAFALFKWAVEESSKGRVVISAEPSGANPQRVVMPALSGLSSGVP